jgi:hypothetical protein
MDNPVTLSQLSHDDDFWRNKKIRMVQNLADDSVFSAVLTSSHSRAPGQGRKRCIRKALKIQDFLACPVENLIAIIRNQGEYITSHPRDRDALRRDVRWQLLSLQKVNAISIE